MAGESILLVDTEKNILITYQAVLEEEGFRVDIAFNEKEAFKKLESNNFAVLVTEFYLKGENTLNMVKQVKKHHPEIYIIMISAVSLNAETYEEVIDAGVDDFFTKPFYTRNLLANIKKGFKRRASIIETIQSRQRLDKMEHMFDEYPCYSDQDKSICHSYCFLKRLKDEIIRAERYNHTFSLLLFDISKSGNGKNKPDSEKSQEIANEISAILLKNTRQTDVITYYNGDFALILLETPKDGTKVLAGRLKGKITSIPQHQHIVENVTCDSVSYPEQSESIRQWISEVDRKRSN